MSNIQMPLMGECYSEPGTGRCFVERHKYRFTIGWLSVLEWTLMCLGRTVKILDMLVDDGS